MSDIFIACQDTELWQISTPSCSLLFSDLQAVALKKMHLGDTFRNLTTLFMIVHEAKYNLYITEFYVNNFTERE